MKKFDTALADPEVPGHVQDNRRDGLGLGVQGTPTFFFDGKMVATPGSYEAFKTLIDDEAVRLMRGNTGVHAIPH